jgi:hypothetical protein
LENRTSTVGRSYPVAATTSTWLGYWTATELRLVRVACFCSLPEAVRARDAQPAAQFGEVLEITCRAASGWPGPRWR